MQNSKQQNVNESVKKRKKMTGKDWTRIMAALLAGITVLSVAFGTAAYLF